MKSIGEEASHYAVYPLRESDWVYPSYREQGAWFWRGYTIEQFVNQLFGNAGARHGNDIVRRHGTCIDGPAHARRNFGSVLCFDIVERSANGSATHRTNSSPDRCTGRRISNRIANDRPNPRAS